MKSISIYLLCLLLVVAFAPSCSKPTNPAETTLYTCGMHPQVVQDHPGDCPICGLKLEPVRKQPSPKSKVSAKDAGSRKIEYYRSTMLLSEISKSPRKDSMGMDMVPIYEGENESKTIAVDPATVQKMGVRTALVTKGPLRRVIRTVGAIDYNETALADVTTKFRGWIENLHVDSTGKQVHKGEPLFDIYSPDLYSAQNEYVLALRQTGASGMKESARQKLRLFDISENQITELERSRQAQRTLRVDAPIDGIVVEKMAVRGQMVEAGMKLYRLADLSIVWVQSQVYEQDLALLQLGQEAEVSLSYLPDRKFRGRVTYIYPTVDEKTRTARVRMEFHNPGLFLKPGMFATVELRAELKPDALLVPDAAVLRSGEKNTVFVALDGGHFEPRDVVLGARADNDAYEILSGLREGDRVVTSGQFMLDSESQLREAIQKMLKPVAPGVAAEAAAQRPNPNIPTQTTPAPDAQTGSQEYVCPTGYACPMPDHMSIKYNHSGKCPICGMTLIPAPGEGVTPTPSPTANPPGHQP
jgi:membrane fusion protein, copper/silver efflux system